MTSKVNEVERVSRRRALGRSGPVVVDPPVRQAAAALPVGATVSRGRKLAKRSAPSPVNIYLARTAILEGAAKLLGKRGSADVTVEEILRASKISRATFYRFFQNKEDVLDALYEVWAMTLAGAMRSVVVGGGTGPEKLQRALEEFMRFHLSVGPLMRVLQAESLRPGSSLVARKEVLHQALADILDAKLRGHYDLRVDPLVLRALIVTMEGVSSILLKQNEPIDTERALRVMLRVVIATLAPEGSKLPPLPLSER